MRETSADNSWNIFKKKNKFESIMETNDKRMGADMEIDELDEQDEQYH